MDEDAQLQARIAALSGKINRRKQDRQPHVPPVYQREYSYAPQSHRGSHRWSPYTRGTRGGQLATHKNRTLVLNGSSTGPSNASHVVARDTAMVDAATHADPKPQPAFISTRRAKTNQLMTKDTFEREQQQKLGYQAQQTGKTGAIPGPNVSREPRQTTEKHPAHALRELKIDGIRFQMLHDGSKLIRIPGESESAFAASSGLSDADAVTQTTKTPKKYRIADVVFFRTKRGNLVRAGGNPIDGRYPLLGPPDAMVRSSPQLFARPVKRTPKPQCEHFTKHGTCPFGPSCKFSHDPTKVAMCKDFLRTGSCPAGKSCDLSHEATYHRVSACAHFLRGNCTNNACRYPHIHVSPAAPVCRPFATLGYCPKGPDCDKRHVFECPDHSNHGHCENREKGSCSLPHIDRASALRKAAERQARTGNEDESDVTSDEEEEEEEEAYDSDAIDSDVDVFTGSDDLSHELSQQKDFVSFIQ